ncbi:MAG: YcaO-like family protein [Bdellovibrionota bacterium]
MASDKKLGRWLYNNREALNLQVLQGRWVDEWLPGYQDLRVEITLDHKIYNGRGVDRDTDMALIKAGAEAIERFACDKYGIHSSGVASHITERQAKENARLELLERDGFLCHFYTKTPFEEVPDDVKEALNFDFIQNRLCGLGVEIVLKKVNQTSPLIAVCLARRKGSTSNFQAIVGLGANKEILIACEKALIECLSNVVWRLEQNDFPSIGIEDFQAIENHGPKDHQKLYMSEEFKGDLQWAFQKKMEAQDNSKSFEENNPFDYRELNLDHELVREAPLWIYQCLSSKVQNLNYGPPKKEHINWNRLREFTGLAFEDSQLNVFPHPIG